VQARCNHLSAFARPRPDRFSTGYVIEALQSTTEAIESIQDPKERQAKKDEQLEEQEQPSDWTNEWEAYTRKKINFPTNGSVMTLNARAAKGSLSDG
jgi:hypothetical protein